MMRWLRSLVNRLGHNRIFALNVFEGVGAGDDNVNKRSNYQCIGGESEGP